MNKLKQIILHYCASKSNDDIEINDLTKFIPLDNVRLSDIVSGALIYQLKRRNFVGLHFKIVNRLPDVNDFVIANVDEWFRKHPKLKYELYLCVRTAYDTGRWVDQINTVPEFGDGMFPVSLMQTVEIYVKQHNKFIKL